MSRGSDRGTVLFSSQIALIAFSIHPATLGPEVLKLFKDLHASAAAGATKH